MIDTKARIATAEEILGASTAASSFWIWLGVLGLVALGLYAPLMPALIREWAAFRQLSHGFAVPFIAAYLVWCRRAHLREVRPAPSLWGLPLLLVGLGALVVGVHGQESFVARVSLPVTLLGLTIFLAGPAVARYLWIGIAYLVFMIPLPWTTLKLLAYHSRFFDADVSAVGLDWLGVPVYQDGVFLHLPSVTLEVADECSSVQSVTALLALGVAYVAVVRRPTAIRVALVVMTLPLAIASNIIRIVTTAASAHYLGTWTLQSAYHTFNGSVNFLLTLLLLLVLDTALVRWAGARVRCSAEGRDSSGDSHVDRQSRQRSVVETGRSLRGRVMPRREFFFGAALALLCTAGALVQIPHDVREVPLARSFELFPTLLNGWSDGDPVPDDVFPVDGQAPESLRRGFHMGPRTAWVSVAYYPKQSEGERPAVQKLFLPLETDRILARHRVQIPLDEGPGRTIPANLLVIETGVRRAVLLYWYQILDRPIASDHWYRAILLLNRVVHGRAEGALVRIASPVGGSTDPGTIPAEQAEFVRVFYPELLKSLTR